MKLEKTKKGLAAAWECGGGATNTGSATIIAGAHGEALRPLYVRTRGDLSNRDHALFVVEAGMHVITADHHRGDFVIRISRIAGIAYTVICGTKVGGGGLDIQDAHAWQNSRGTRPAHTCHNCGAVAWEIDPATKTQWVCTEKMPTANLALVAKFDRGEWSGDFDPDNSELRAAIEAAMEKARCYHCREPHYVFKEAATKAA